jgi:hypothetical protein
LKNEDPKPAAAPPPPHLSAAMRIVAECLGLPRVSMAATRYMLIEAARQQAAGSPRPDVAKLCRDLEHETGRSIAELAEAARSWSDASPPAPRA